MKLTINSKQVKLKYFYRLGIVNKIAYLFLLEMGNKFLTTKKMISIIKNKADTIYLKKFKCRKTFK